MKRIHMVVQHGGSYGSSPLRPEVLNETLDKYAEEGWLLLTYDWSSWKTAVFYREDAS